VPEGGQRLGGATPCGGLSVQSVRTGGYCKAPDELTAREVLVDGQILVNTLLNQRKVRKGTLDQLYAQRWNVELDHRNIKTTLGVEVLRSMTPRMVEKELWVRLLA
jgi:hypothetical protein